jgi:hypothetical protein
LGSNQLTEFEKFDAQVFAEPYHRTEQQIIYSTVAAMGERGAKLYYFRPERQALALPGHVDESIIKANPTDYGVRLYCGLLRPDLVLLLNGGIKTELDPEQCPNVRPHFRNAVNLMRVILKAEQDDFVRFTSDGIEIDEGFDIEI